MLAKTILGTCLLLFSTPAFADYQGDKDNGNMDAVKHGLDKFKKNPSLFNGKRIVRGAQPEAVSSQVKACNDTIITFNKYYQRISDKGKATARANALVGRAKALDPWCRTLTAQGNAYLASAAKAQQAAAAQAQADKNMCSSVGQAAFKADSKIGDTLDAWKGLRGMNVVGSTADFRIRINALAAICKKAGAARVVSKCAGDHLTLSSSSNARYDVADICRAAGDPKKTLGEIAKRVVEYAANGSDTEKKPTLQSIRFQGGFMKTKQPITYATYFVVTDQTKELLLKMVNATYSEAGIAPPKDLTFLWESRQKTLDELKRLVDETRGEWTMGKAKSCKGYTCKIAKKMVLQHQNKAKIKKIYAGAWHVVKNSVGYPIEQYIAVEVLYQLPGEKGCQLRNIKVTENYKGGGRYAKAKAAPFSYVRFQNCK